MTNRCLAIWGNWQRCGSPNTSLLGYTWEGDFMLHHFECEDCGANFANSYWMNEDRTNER